MAYEDLLGASRGFEACFFLFFLLSREASILLICWAILLLKMLLLAIKIINMKTSIYYSRSKPFICTPLLLFFILVAMMLANITLYNSNKVVFQGKNADIDAKIWFDLEYSLNNS